MGEGLAGLHRPYRVVAVRQENAVTRTFVLDGSLAAAPGQFVMAWLPGMDEKPFSLAHAAPVTLTVAAVGPFSRALHHLSVGDRLWLRGPLGQGYTLPHDTTPLSPWERAGAPSSPLSPRERAGVRASLLSPWARAGVRASPLSPWERAGVRAHTLLIGGGYGVAPLRFLAERLLAADYAVSMIIGARTAADLLLIDAFQSMDVRLWLTTEDGSAGLRGLATDAIDPALSAVSEQTAMVYACGPTGMLRAVAALCRAKGLPMQLSWEAHMRCAIGLCGSCEVGAGWLTCLDGPVFRFNPTVQNRMGEITDAGS